LPELDDGAIAPHAADALIPSVARVDALLVGTGAVDGETTGGLFRALVPAVAPDAVVVVDAGALPVLADEPQLLAPLRGRAIVIPNPTEMARVLRCDDERVAEDPGSCVEEAVERLGVVVALRGPDTWIGAPGGERFLDRSGHPALATAGSGDVLAGTLAGLVARGADALTAALWAVHAHADAGRRIIAAGGGLGLLARELVDELPRALNALCA
jgi:NAD(P)H-hydrate repair Nnr-like enzyme with NAD(P)H-hydrate dehydratase domain